MKMQATDAKAYERSNKKNADKEAMQIAAQIVKTISEFAKKCDPIWNGEKPLSKLFKTNSRGYLYDTGTNKILGCSDNVFELLELLNNHAPASAAEKFISTHSIEAFIDAADIIKNTIDKENVFQVKKAIPFGLSKNNIDYEELIDSAFEILFLEVTESCNLRCGYCVYGNHVKSKRNHGERQMTFSTAKKAIDYLNAHSFRRKKVAVCFYGGEPLLNFPLIKSGTEYAQTVLKQEEIDFFITTNATLITPEIAAFLLKYKFSVHTSIDGPKEIHDNFRVDTYNKGSYHHAIQGLKLLVDGYGEQAKDKISLSMVYTPPFSGKRIARASELWAELPWLPKEMKLNITYPGPGTIPKQQLFESNVPEDIDLQQWAFEKFMDHYTGKGEFNAIAASIIERALAVLIQRPIFSSEPGSNFLNGCCIPGVRRIYAAADGKFHLCERISSEAPTIGDVDFGIDKYTIRKIYIDEYENICTPLCSSCWAVRLCTSCYTDAFINGKLDSNALKEHCLVIQESQLRFLRYYCSAMEINPEGLDYLYQYKLT